MSNPYLPLGQGVPVSTKGAFRWRNLHRPLSEGDLAEFFEAPQAPFLIREVEPDDGLALPPRWRDRLGARHLVIVHRSGDRRLVGKPGWYALGKAVDEALVDWQDCPALAADADFKGEAGAIGPFTPSPIISAFVYVHAPGSDIILGRGYAARIFRDCDLLALRALDAFTLGALQRSEDRRRRFDMRRLSVDLGFLAYPRWLLTRRGWKAKS